MRKEGVYPRIVQFLLQRYIFSGKLPNKSQNAPEKANESGYFYHEGNGFRFIFVSLPKKNSYDMHKTIFLTLVLATIFCVSAGAQSKMTVSEKNFPVSVQFSPVPSGNGWHGEEGPVSDEVKKQTIRNLIEHGVTHISTSSFANPGVELKYAQEQGMMLDCLTGGVELFHRNFPPEHSVFSPEYQEAMRAQIEPVLGGVRHVERPYSIFPFMDEPFHADTTSFDLSEAARQAFQKEYGYTMPGTFSEARKDPRKYMDFINFQSSTFAVAWKKIYEEVKKLDSRPLVTLTHDSHNTLGCGAHSNSVWAVDDVFHWGADFADMFIYDIYPYNCEDYRVGESSLVYKPRMSQFHWTLAQMRNLTETYGKKMGYWVGTFNHAWFSRFMDDTRRSQYWMERETAYTAIAGGADFLMTGFNIPEDARHWDDFGEAMCTVQKDGGALLESKRPKAKACFLFPRTQHVLLNQEYANVALTFELCLRAFGEMDVIHEDQITDDHLLGYKILFLADVDVLPEAVAGRIADFVRKGGIVIADCVPQTDESLRQSATLKDVFGVQSSETYRVKQEGHWIPFTTEEPFWLFLTDEWKTPEKIFDKANGFRVVSPRHCVASDAKIKYKMASGEPLLLTNKYGLGKTYLFGFCIQDTYLQTFIDENETGGEVLRNILRKVFMETKVEASTYSSNPDVEVALRKSAKEAFALVINHEATNPHATLTLSDIGFEVGKVVDIQTGEELKFKKKRRGIQFNVCPEEGSTGGVTRLLKLLPK